MNMFVASPHMYGCELSMFDPLKFQDDYGNQGNTDDNFILMEPSPQNLVMWAKSCLSIGEFIGHHRHGGWSPFRSGEVLVTKRSGQRNIYNFKLGDDDEWDYITSVNGRTVSIQPWIRSINLFTKLALNLYVLKSEQEASLPHVMVLQMIYAEYGECDHDFAHMLYEKGFTPKMLDKVVQEKWIQMIKLPIPSVFMYCHDDDVRLKITDMCRM